VETTGVRHRFISIPPKDRPDILFRLHDGYVVVDGCWVWRFDTGGRGYGRIRIGGSLYPAHRVSYRLFNRRFDQTLHVLHSCDNPACVNPAHLSLGTDADNMQDCAAKGRLPTQVNPAIVQGENNGQHKLTADDVMDIRRSWAAGESQKSLAARHHVKPPTIHKIVTGLKWKHLPLVSRVVRHERLQEGGAA
jgi:hypothetical protein